MSADGSVVSIKGLSKVFGKGGVTALQDIDLEVERGEFVSLIGPSGCGKSTLLRIVGDIVEPHRGRDHRQREAGAQGAARPRLRNRVPGARPLRLAHGGEEHRSAARDARLGPCEARRARPRNARARRARRLRAAPSLAALGRHAAARLDRPRALVLARAPAHGRAVRRARRDDARATQHGAAPHLGGDRVDGRSSSRTPSPRRCSCRRASSSCPRDQGVSRASSRWTCLSPARLRPGRSRGSSSSSRRCESRCMRPAPTKSRRRLRRRATSREHRGTDVRPVAPFRRANPLLAARRRGLRLGLAAWQWLLPDVLGVEDFLLPRFSDVVQPSSTIATCSYAARGSPSRRRSVGSFSEAAPRSWPPSSSPAGVRSAVL